MIYLCDTCILIDYLRGKLEVQQKLQQDREQGLGMSSVTYMELMVGALNKREAGIIKKAFADFEIVEISESISIKAKYLIEKYTKSHGLLIPDALIASTALELGLPLYTTNIKDFQFIDGLVLA
ncbi:type II toxin-antitoxin system VapC family toxin [Treponema sp. OMZ 787]|uniref:type II toxin-antitoxin system VapC family toxin n=1 Tax=Treponema sp. OMZ 787 TaxID=2563669 RepID=UPI0020A31E83|nr:type II toxin-antitoxin system VapC family toxin [Treponema sp. OMZ 787]UTC62840.1 type II toxin-antitoxin system VapC family toxin [Treponema sp. OMZ 787]